MSQTYTSGLSYPGREDFWKFPREKTMFIFDFSFKFLTWTLLTPNVISTFD
jgi:hypothetical protein